MRTRISSKPRAITGRDAPSRRCQLLRGQRAAPTGSHLRDGPLPRRLSGHRPRSWYGKRGPPLEYDFILRPGAVPGRIAIGHARVSTRHPRGPPRRPRPRHRPPALSCQHRGRSPARNEAGPPRAPCGDYVLDGPPGPLQLGDYDRSRPRVIDPRSSTRPTTAAPPPTTATPWPWTGRATRTSRARPSRPTSPSTARISRISPGSGGDRDGFDLPARPLPGPPVFATYFGGQGEDVPRDLPSTAKVTCTSRARRKQHELPEKTDRHLPSRRETTTFNAFFGEVRHRRLAHQYIGRDRRHDLQCDSNELERQLHAGARGIAVDAAGNAYVTGVTNTRTSLARRTRTAAGDTAWPWVHLRCLRAQARRSTRLDPDRAAAQYLRYLGGNSLDEAFAIAVDASERAYVVGRTFSGDLARGRAPAPATRELRRLPHAPERPTESLRPPGSAISEGLRT